VSDAHDALGGCDGGGDDDDNDDEEEEEDDDETVGTEVIGT